MPRLPLRRPGYICLVTFPNTVRCLRVSAIIHFGTDGWRARTDGEFTLDNVGRVADAAADIWQSTHPGATVYVGYDTRPRARELAEVAAGTLSAHGLDVVLVSSPAPTPALTWAVAHDGDACGALMVTGSHHPQGYLCLKLRMGDGSTMPIVRWMSCLLISIRSRMPSIPKRFGRRI